MSLVAVSACAHTPPRVKIYVSDPQMGLVRAQNKEVIPYAESKGFLCISPSDFEVAVTESGE